jgi:hypothetical protein
MLYPPVVQIPSDKFPRALHRPARAARLAGSLAHKEAKSAYVHKNVHNPSFQPSRAIKTNLAQKLLLNEPRKPVNALMISTVRPNALLASRIVTV